MSNEKQSTYDNGNKVATEPANSVSGLSKTGVTNAFWGITLQLDLSESVLIKGHFYNR